MTTTLGIKFCLFVMSGVYRPALSSKVNTTGDSPNHLYATITHVELTPVSETPFGFDYGGTSRLTFNYSFFERNVTLFPKKGYYVTASVDNPNVVFLNGETTFQIDKDQPTGNFTIEVTAKNPGRSRLRFHVHNWLDELDFQQSLVDASLSSQKTYTDLSFSVYVIMKQRPIDVAFNVVIVLLVLTANIGMGTQVDLNIVKAELRRPIAACIGMFSQFIFMPLIAFGTAIFIEAEPGIALGLFACGCAPGGMVSNIFAFLLNGNISLSITMTLVSTFASIALMPLWLFTLGQYLYSDSEVHVPFLNIFISLLMIIIPTVIGLFMQFKTPRAAAIAIKVTKYMLILIVIFVLTFGVYANWWALGLVDGKVLLASSMLPYLGFALGGFAAFVGRQSKRDIITIAIETGIQNTAIPLVVLNLSIKGPERATSMVVPLISSTMTPLPLVFMVVVQEVQNCYRLRKAGQTSVSSALRQSRISQVFTQQDLLSLSMEPRSTNPPSKRESSAVDVGVRGGPSTSTSNRKQSNVTTHSL